jgi:hypothetical protein
MCHPMHYLANGSDHDFQLRNGLHASHHRWTADERMPLFVRKTPSREVISIGWRRYLMSACQSSNHSPMIVAKLKAYACIVRLENRFLCAGTGGCGRSLPRSEVPTYEVLSLAAVDKFGRGVDFSRGRV